MTHEAVVLPGAAEAASGKPVPLRRAKLLRARREGALAGYSAADDHVTRPVADGLDGASHEQPDRRGRGAGRVERPGDGGGASR